MRPKAESSNQKHHREASNLGAISLAIVTVSDSRTPETDDNGKYLKKEIEKLGHQVVGYCLIKDEPKKVESALEEFSKSNAQIILFNGGTGISKRDRTFDVLNKKMEKPLPGFGELFRMLSYKEVGASAMLSRAVAGVYKNKVIISTPGSPNAVKVAWEKLIVSELQHLAWEITR